MDKKIIKKRELHDFLSGIIKELDDTERVIGAPPTKNQPDQPKKKNWWKRLWGK